LFDISLLSQLNGFRKEAVFLWANPECRDRSARLHVGALISGSAILNPFLCWIMCFRPWLLSGWGDTNQLRACHRAAKESGIMTMPLES
jgi:hypothetical protein